MASDDQDALLAKIGQLAGQINRHKNGQGSTHQSQYTALNGNSYANNSHHSVGYNPYGAYKPRGSYPTRPYGRGVRPTSLHRNRSLVLNGNTNTNPVNTTADRIANNENASASTPGTWVTKTDRHMQLINSSIYEKDSQKRRKAIEETWKQKLKKRDDHEKAKLIKHLRRNDYQSSVSTGTDRKYEIDVQGISFHVAKNGSKLVKAPGEDPTTIISKRSICGGSINGLQCSGDTNAARATPKFAVIGGVKFHRTKNGNLYRSAIVKAHGYATGPIQPPLFQNTDRYATRKPRIIKKIEEPCQTFTTTGIPFPIDLPTDSHVHIVGRFGLQLTCSRFLGSCLKGPRCRYIHDPSKVSVCREFLFKGSCPSGDSCDLSHELTPERTPSCLHFSKGNCSNTACRYMHIRVSPSALVCRAFGIYGYCDKGADCAERHVHECPDFSNTGTCTTRGCKLLHRHKASVMRSNTLRSDELGEDDASDISSDEDAEEIGSDDVDSDDLDGEYFGDDDGTMDLDMPMQKDFVRL